MSNARRISTEKAMKVFAGLPPERQDEALRFMLLLQEPSFVPAKRPGEIARVSGTLKPHLADEMQIAVKELCEIEPEC